MADLIDTHAHLDSEQFPDLSAVIARARAAGVVQMVAVGITAPSSAACVALAAEHDAVFATVGVHPNETAEVGPDARDAVAGLIGRPKVVGIGETGLDRYRDWAPFDKQQVWFAWHLALGREHGLPVVIHCRDADDDVTASLRQEQARRGGKPIEGVIHSFAGSLAFARTVLQMGLYVSFSGSLTYDKANDLRSVAAVVAAEWPDRFLVETDAPYLTPVPLRGKQKRNEPANVVHTAACLAGVLGVSPDELAARTTANARRLFRLPEC